MLFWISLMDKWSFCDEIEFLHVWTCQFDFFTLIAGCRSESKFKTQDHRPSDHFVWLEILRLNYEYFSYSPICERGEEKFYVCINSLISAQMIIALSIFFLPQSFLSFILELWIYKDCKWFTTFVELFHKGCKHVWTIPRCQTLTTREKENCKWIFDEKEYWKLNELIPDLENTGGETNQICFAVDLILVAEMRAE